MFLNCDVPTEVSPEDFDYLSGFEFKLHIKGYLWCRQKPHANKLLHQIVAERMGLIVSEGIDHRDTNKLNNCRFNLRPATNSQNQANTNLQKNNTSGYRGVSFDNTKRKWQARIVINLKTYFLGYFDTPEEAYNNYTMTFEEHYGEFAHQG